MNDRFNNFCDKLIKWCIFSIVFAAPFSKSISEIAITLAIALWLIKKIAGRDFSLPVNDLTVPFVILVLTVIPSFLNTAYFDLSLKAVFTKMLKYVAVYFVIVDTMNSKDRLRELMIIWFISVIVIMLDGFGQYHYSGVDVLHIPGYPSFKYRPTSELDSGFFRGFPTACFPFPNDLAAWLLLVIFPITAVAILDLKNNTVRYLVGAVPIGLLYLFTLAKVRGAWLGLAISFIYIAVSKRKFWIMLILILALAMPYLLNMEMSRYTFSVSSFGDRISMWGTSWEIFKLHPFIGSGINTFFRNYQELRNDEWKGKKGSYAHNCYLQMAADTGVVGLAGFVWLMIAYFLSVIKSLKKIRDPFFGPILWGMSIGIFAFLIHSAFDTNLYSLNLATLFWTSIGISQAVAKVCRGEDAYA